MQQGILTYIFCCCLLWALLSCEEPYEPDIDPQSQSILVIEGDITDSTMIRISRTSPLSAEGFRPVQGALVQVESHKRGVIARPGEWKPGLYGAILNPEPGEQYRLKVTTPNGTHIESDWVEALDVPDIDALYYEVSGGDVEIFVDTESDLSTAYYRWTYTETWQYTSRFPTNLKWDGKAVVSRLPGEKIWKCYKTVESSEIVIGSTADLARDKVKRQLIREVDPMGSNRLHNVYSILVQQQRISRGAFEFWRLLKNNTEGLGSIFDAQPSRLPTNFHTVNSNEPVIGYLSAGKRTEKRLYIERSKLPFTEYYDPYVNCRLDTVPYGMFPPPLSEIFGDSTLIPVIRLGGNSYLASARLCVDCRVKGGTTTQPAYWPF